MIKIKVIKKAELKNLNKTYKPAEIKTAQQTNEKMASTVSQWVNDREKQRQSESRWLGEKFFVSTTGKRVKRKG